MAEVNPLSGLVTFLRAEASVNALTAARVYGPDGVPTQDNASMPRHAIVISPAGGARAIGGGYQTFGDKRVDIACFGKSQHASHELYLEVEAVLMDLKRELVAASADQKVLLHWARISADATTGLDPDTEWPMTLSSWQVLASRVGVPI